MKYFLYSPFVRGCQDHQHGWSILLVISTQFFFMVDLYLFYISWPIKYSVTRWMLLGFLLLLLASDLSCFLPPFYDFEKVGTHTSMQSVSSYIRLMKQIWIMEICWIKNVDFSPRISLPKLFALERSTFLNMCNHLCICETFLEKDHLISKYGLHLYWM